MPSRFVCQHWCGVVVPRGPATNPGATASSPPHPLAASPSHTNCPASFFPGPLPLLSPSAPAPRPELPVPWPPSRPPPWWPRRSPPAGAAAHGRGSRRRPGAPSCGAPSTPASPTWASTVRNGTLRRVPSYLTPPGSFLVRQLLDFRGRRDEQKPGLV
jgi:hypothetical protein